MSIGRKFAYVDGLAILQYASDWQVLEGLLLRIWQPYPPTVTNGSSSSVQQILCWQPSIFTTRNHDMSLTSLSVDRSLLFCTEPTYLNIKLDRALMFHQHLESLHKKLTFCIGLLRQLAGSSWGVDATILCTATLALVYSTAEYYAPVWCHSTHTCLIDKPIYNALHIVTRCLCPTPINNLFILAGIQPTELCHQKAVLSLACCAQEPEHFLYERLLSPLGGHLQKLKSRHSFMPAALELLNVPI